MTILFQLCCAGLAVQKTALITDTIAWGFVSKWELTAFVPILLRPEPLPAGFRDSIYGLKTNVKSNSYLTILKQEAS